MTSRDYGRVLIIVKKDPAISALHSAVGLDGIILPDRKIPAQWIMFDLFEEMRATDRPLADELLKPTIDFLRAQVDGNRMKRMNLDEYFAYRNADLGKG